MKITTHSFGQKVSNSTITSNIEKLLNTMHQNQQFNGTVLIAKKGKIITEQSFGYANPETGEKLTERSSFRLASVSKQFAAMGIMILKERGKLDYDDDIRLYLPELPYDGITIRHLLHHTGGLPDYMGLFEKNWESEKEFDDRSMAYNKDVVTLFAKYKPNIDFEPGEKYAYSNTGYVLLGEIIGRVSKQPIADFFQKNIFDPLEMKDSRAYSLDDKFQLESRVYGFQYTSRGTIPNEWTFINGMIGDGGIYASAQDLLKWDQALYTEKLVKQSTLKEAFTSGKLNDGTETGYGFGWGVSETDNGELTVSHSGGWVGFRTNIIRVLDEKLTVITLTNHSSNHLGHVIREVKNIYDGNPFFIPKPLISDAIINIIREKGIDDLIVEFDNLKKNEGDKYNIEEGDINALGYQFLGNKEFENAIAVFKLNVREYPDSWNVYDSLGEAYLEASKVNYRKSILMNPGNEAGKKILSHLEE
jgi:CubicO group peptidase (beta-lactamase class C family)